LLLCIGLVFWEVLVEFTALLVLCSYVVVPLFYNSREDYVSNLFEEAAWEDLRMFSRFCYFEVGVSPPLRILPTYELFIIDYLLQLLETSLFPEI
jgi:hypothetical protein